MATDSDFSLRTALIRTFQDSDVLLSKVAQNDAKYVYGARVSRDKVRMLMQAQDKFFELQQEMARISFEFPDSLEDAATAVNATVKTSPWLSRGINVAPFDQEKVLCGLQAACGKIKHLSRESKP